MKFSCRNLDVLLFLGLGGLVVLSDIHILCGADPTDGFTNVPLTEANYIQLCKRDS